MTRLDLLAWQSQLHQCCQRKVPGLAKFSISGAVQSLSDALHLGRIINRTLKPKHAGEALFSIYLNEKFISYLNI